MKNFFKLFLVFLIIACGKKEVPEGMTRVLFKTPDDKAITAYSLNKGLVVYGMNVDQGKSAAGWGSNIGNFISSNSEIILPNGRYKFFALGYDDNGTPGNDALHTDSKVFCGEGNGGQEIVLSGGVVSVSLTLVDSAAGSNCAEAFSGSDWRTSSPNTNSYKPLTITFCNSGGATSGGCASATAAGIVSAEIKITGYDKIKNNMDFDFNKAIPGCVSVASAQMSLLQKIPYRMPFHFSIKAFGSGGCTGTLLGIYDFPNGVEGASFNPNMGLNNGTTGVSIFIKQ